MLNETDILENRIFEDAICYGGWNVDLHTPHGLLDLHRHPSGDSRYFDGIYTIPYRSYYSKNISNLFMAGRIISATKLAYCSTRIIGCCAIGGEAVGIAAALCKKYNCTPRELAPAHIKELQQEILKADGFLPEIYNEDPNDFARNALFSASGCIPGAEPDLVAKGASRKLGDNWNGWVSDGIGVNGETLKMQLKKPEMLSQIRLTLWSDFNYPIRVTMAPNRQKQQREGIPPELIKDYTIRLMHDGRVVREIEIKDNHQRLNTVNFEKTLCDNVEIIVHSTHGHENAVIFEVRAY